MNVSDLVTETLNAPILRCLVNGLGDVNVQGSTFLEDMVETQLTDLGAHGGLGELRDGVLCVLNTVGGLVSIENANV